VPAVPTVGKETATHITGCRDPTVNVHHHYGPAAPSYPRRGRSLRMTPYEKKKKQPPTPLRYEDIKCAFPRAYFETLRATLTPFQCGVARKRICEEPLLTEQRHILLDSFDVALKRARQTKSEHLPVLLEQRRLWFAETELQGGFDTYLGPPAPGGSAGAGEVRAEDRGGLASGSSAASTSQDAAASTSSNPEPMDTSGETSGKNKIFGKNPFK
jgi:hypothetical protein